jgi:hypothetical protein
MNTAKLNTMGHKNNSPLTIAHKASSSPFYYVEEAEIGHSKVSVSFFNENDPASEIETASIPTKDLIEFTNEFYRDYVDVWDAVADMHVQERIEKADMEYLRDNLTSVVTDFLNARKEAANV